MDSEKVCVPDWISGSSVSVAVPVCGGEVEAHLCYHQKNMVSCNLYKWWKLGSYTGLLSLLSMIGWEAQISRRRLRPLTRMPLGWLLQELYQTSLTGWSPWGWPRTCWREPQEELELVIEMSGMTFSACCQHLFLKKCKTKIVFIIFWLIVYIPPQFKYLYRKYHKY